MFLISGSEAHSFLIPALFTVLVKRDKATAASIARYYMRALRDAHVAENDAELRSARSIRTDLILEIIEAIDETAPGNAYFASRLDDDGTLHWGFFKKISHD